MPITDRDAVNHREAARIIGTGLWAGLRRGYLTPEEADRIDRTLANAEIREDEKAEIRRAAREAAERADFEARKRKAVGKAVGRVERKHARKFW